MPEQLRVSHNPPEFWEKKHGRTTNMTGVVVNDFEITGYVGDNWRTSLYAKFKHIPCGTEGSVLAREAKCRLENRKCSTCKKAGRQ